MSNQGPPPKDQEDSRPPFWRAWGTEWIGQHKFPIIMILTLLAVSAIIAVGWNFFGKHLTELKIPGRVFVAFLLMAASLLFVGFAVIFTGEKPKISLMSGYAYIFTMFALFALTLPFFGFFFTQPWAQHVESAPMAILIGCVLGEQSDKGELLCDGSNFQWVINIGGTTTTIEANPAKPKWRPVMIRGGLVVPLYFIILAIMGSAVGMMRTVPEYQRRAWVWETQNNSSHPLGSQPAETTRAAPGEEPISPHDARKLIVFQILQVVSAPLIAIVAYTLIKPEAIATTAAVGFAAGFGAEPILLLIGSVTSALRPQGSASV